MPISDDMMGVLLKVKGEVEKKLSESKVTEEEVLPLTEDMIISSVMQVSSLNAGTKI